MSIGTSFASHEVTGTSFGFYTDEEVLQLSVKKIDAPRSLNRLMKPVDGGLYDPCMGPTEKDQKYVLCFILLISFYIMFYDYDSFYFIL